MSSKNIPPFESSLKCASIDVPSCMREEGERNYFIIYLKVIYKLLWTTLDSSTFYKVDHKLPHRPYIMVWFFSHSGCPKFGT